MALNDVVLTGIVAAAVSIVTAFISYLANQRAIVVEREKFERGLQRSLTEKLYERRLAAYPDALRLTEPLRKSNLWNKEKPLSKEYLQHVLTELESWNINQAAFLLSHQALEALWELRRALRDDPSEEGQYSEEQLMRMWKAKDRFRKELRKDIFLLFGEELERNV